MYPVTSTQLILKPTQNLRLFAGLASAGFVLTGIVNTFLGPLLPILAARWALTDSRAGYFFATQFLGSIAGVTASSFLLPRRGFRFTIGLSYLLMAVGVRGLALSQWKYALMSTLIFGFGFGLVIPATNLFVSRVNQNRRASALSILNFCWGIGAVLTPVAIYFSASKGQVLAFLIILSGLLSLTAISVAFTSGGEPPLKEQNFNDHHSPEHPSHGNPLADLAQKKPAWHFVAMVGGMFFLYVAIESSVGGWIATLAERVSSVGTGRWFLAPSLFWAGLLAGRGLAPLVLNRVRERQLAIAGLALAGSCMCVLVFSSHWQWITAAGFFVGLGLAAIFPITVALLSRFQAAETRNAGLMFALSGLGGAVMPWLVGAVSTKSGSLQVGLMVPLVGTVILLWLHAVGNHGSQPTAETQR
ncbi:MAG TPA: MFS transporter [Candidatus Angelobacter sp.]|nr:MFS transporter [Candidatus Angelobacter sp.]